MTTEWKWTGPQDLAWIQGDIPVTIDPSADPLTPLQREPANISPVDPFIIQYFMLQENGDKVQKAMMRLLAGDAALFTSCFRSRRYSYQRKFLKEKILG